MPIENEPAADNSADFERKQELLHPEQDEHAGTGPSPDDQILSLLREAYIIGLAVTQDIHAAKAISLETLSEVGTRSGGPRAGSKAAIRTQILKISRRRSRETVREPITPPPAQGVDAVVWRLLDGLDWRERLVCVLKYAMGLSPAESAELLRVAPGAVLQQAAIIDRRFRSELVLLAEASAADPLELAAASITRRYSPPAWSAEQLAELVEAAGRLKQPAVAPVPARSAGKWLIIGAGLAFAAVCLGFFLIAGVVISRFVLPEPQESSSTEPSSTDLPSSRSPGSLSWISSSAAVLERIQQSASLWQTIFMDVQIVDFGPQAYIGAPRIYRGQVWVDQPAESIQLFGLLSRAPSSAYFYTGERSLYLNPVDQTSYSARTVLPGVSSLTRPAVLVENQRLRQMVFPREARWAAEPGTFRMVNTGSVADRPVVVVDWFNQYGQREARLWLDAEYGVILRQQDYGGPDFSTLLADSLVTTISFDQSFPPASLAADLRTVGSSSLLIPGNPSIAIQPTPTAAIPIGRREVIAPNPAPPGFDPRTSQLLFQFPYNLDLTNVMTATARVPVQLFADSYGIGATEFGLPWMLRCKRSPNGYRLAFNTGSDGTSHPDDELRWLDIREPQKVFEPLPGMHADTFAFSSDLEQIAVFARSSLEAKSGISIVKIATGESRQVISLLSGQSLVWSPDGETLALVGTVEENDREQALQIHIRTGQIIFQEPMPPVGSQIPQDWPMSNWGIPFPQSEGGLDACAAAP